MAVIFIRTTIVFVVLVIVMRLMGKRQIGEMQPFEFIVTLIIADLACIPMADVSIPLIYGIVAVLTLFFLHQLLSFVEQSGAKAKKFISGKPSVVIDKDGVNMSELKKNNLSVDDLIESMRAMGYFSLDDLKYAIFESNGKLSAFPNDESTDKPSSFPILIVDNGKIYRQNAERIDKTDDEISLFIKSKNGDLLSTEVMTVDGNGRVYIKLKNKKYSVEKIELKEKIKW